MKRMLLFCLVLLLSITAQNLQAQLIENGSFEDTGECISFGGRYLYAYRDMCLGENWKALSGIPSVEESEAAIIGEKYTNLYVGNPSPVFPADERMIVYYDNLELEAGRAYDLSFIFKISGFDQDQQEDDILGYRVLAADEFLFPEGAAYGLPALDNTEDNLLNFEVVVEGQGLSSAPNMPVGWQEVVITEFIPENNYSMLIFEPILVAPENARRSLLLDDVQLQETPCNIEPSFTYEICQIGDLYEITFTPDFPEGEHVWDLIAIYNTIPFIIASSNEVSGSFTIPYYAPENFPLFLRHTQTTPNCGTQSTREQIILPINEELNSDFSLVEDCNTSSNNFTITAEADVDQSAVGIHYWGVSYRFSEKDEWLPAFSTSGPSFNWAGATKGIQYRLCHWVESTLEGVCYESERKCLEVSCRNGFPNRRPRHFSTRDGQAAKPNTGNKVGTVPTAIKDSDFGLLTTADVKVNLVPNPFRERTLVSFIAPQNGDYQLQIFNSLGQLEATEKIGYTEQETAVRWPLSAEQFSTTGLYLVRVVADGEVLRTERLVRQ